MAPESIPSPRRPRLRHPGAFARDFSSRGVPTNAEQVLQIEPGTGRVQLIGPVFKGDWSLGTGCGSKLNRRGYAGFGPCFHLPGFHFGTGFLSHSQLVGHLIGTFMRPSSIWVLTHLRRHVLGHRCPFLVWLNNRGRFLVCLVVQSSTRETHLFSLKDTYGQKPQECRNVMFQEVENVKST